MKSLGVSWNDAVREIPLNLLFLWARQDQYNYNDKVMTLGDKELIDKMNQTNREKN